MVKQHTTSLKGSVCCFAACSHTHTQWYEATGEEVGVCEKDGERGKKGSPAVMEGRAAN